MIKTEMIVPIIIDDQNCNDHAHYKRLKNCNDHVHYNR